MRSQPTIYLCDDDEGVRNSLSFLLKQHGFTVRAFASGPELLDAVDAVTPPLRGVFVLDVRMEPLPGPVVHDRLREKGYAARNPVIFLSGHGDISAAVAAMAKGALNFVEKPATDDKLIISFARRWCWKKSGRPRRGGVNFSTRCGKVWPRSKNALQFWWARATSTK
jgi:FixJ family two-component response regulator